MINSTILMSGVQYFADYASTNPFMDKDTPIDLDEAKREHDSIQAAL